MFNKMTKIFNIKLVFELIFLGGMGVNSYGLHYLIILS